MLAREGTTAAKLKKLKGDIPSSRKISKTDLAKYLNAWDGKPHLVSFGSQKNFERFMSEFTSGDGVPEAALPDVAAYKQMVAKAILFKTAQRLIRSMFPAFQANVTTYTVSIISDRLGDRLDLDKIWQDQAVSTGLQEQIKRWARQVNDVLHSSAGGKMVSEWAKKAECWEAVRKIPLSTVGTDIPELR